MSDTSPVSIDRDFCAAQSGDQAAFSRLVAATQRMVASVALAVTADVDASEDIAQDAFLAAWRSLRLMRGPASFLPWLRQVARNRAIDHVRSARYRETTEDRWDDLVADVATAGPSPAETLIARQDAALLAQALDDVPADSREVLLLFYREAQSVRAVAVLLGLTEAAVRKRLQRARDGLRAEIVLRVGAAAGRTAPGAAFTALVGAGLALPSAPSAAAGFGAGAWLKFAPKAVLGTFGALLASIALVVGAVAWEIRSQLGRLRDAADRRAMVQNGVVYAALMATYILLLARASDAGWERGEILVAAFGFSVAIVVLAVRRARLIARTRNDTDASP